LLNWPHVHPPHDRRGMQGQGSLALAHANVCAFLIARVRPVPRAPHRGNP